MKSKQANALRGISNPNLIMPGQQLTFRFNDGFDTTYTVAAGDYQCKIVRGMLATMPAIHGQVEPYGDTTEQAAPEKEAVAVTPVPAVIASSYDGTFLGVPWWGWLIIALLIYAFIRIVRDAMKADRARNAAQAERERNPATAGPAMYPSGITNENAHSIMMDNAHRQFPMQNIRIGLIERGTLDSHGVAKEVGYADHPRQMVLSNTPGIRATVFVDNSEQPTYVYSILQCGNDIRMGAGIAYEGITFTPTPNAQPVYVAPLPVQHSTEEVVVADPGVTTMKDITSKLTEIVNKAIDAQTGVNITFDATPGKNNLFIQVLKPGSTKKDA